MYSTGLRLLRAPKQQREELLLLLLSDHIMSHYNFTHKHQQESTSLSETYLPPAFRSICAMSLVSSLVPTAFSSPLMSGTAFLRPVRSQLMKSEYDDSTSIICPWPVFSCHLKKDRERNKECRKRVRTGGIYGQNAVVQLYYLHTVTATRLTTY